MKLNAQYLPIWASLAPFLAARITIGSCHNHLKLFKHYNSDTFAIVDGLELESNHHIHSESLLMRTGKVSCCRFYYNMAAPSNLNVSLQASRKEPL
ncbi:uncharacterized protein C8R40DRAFT_1109737 [Lentinula edodes]|uniref:uncharacterized protein n=1 Tax=Lentinula edodes TaxID=5353 RepID=UPI001E8CDB2B|nr:uncharacterized protein C8R40DRAFT_1109737 [Lentinula edodes]KAH7874186.1 hypothetical protein C8R40DRAFT_1109737 [Lentinula edodes]